MAPQKTIERLSQLINKGEEVLGTHRPHPPNVIGFPTLDRGAFTEWKTQSLACIVSLFDAGHVYVDDFKQHVKEPYHGHVNAGLGILRAAKQDVEAQEEQNVTQSYYDTAQVCLNGHVITSMAETYPQHRQKFCEICAEPTIMNCQTCNAPIRGFYHVPGVYGTDDYRPPSFCNSCGAAFPWTERRQKAAIDLFLEESQDDNERREFRESIEQVTKNTPQAQVASKRIMRLLGKIGKETASAIRDILVDVASEAAKKILFPGT